MLNAFIPIASAGFILMFYAYWVEVKIKTAPNFKPYCDINDQISCTRVINSDYSNLFLLPNAVWGMLYYLAIGVLAFFELRTLLFLAAIAGLIATLFFVYLLFFKIKSYCLVCIAGYIVNICLFIAAYAAFMQGLNL